MTETRLDWDKVEFKPAFVERYKQLTDWDSFRDYSLRYLNKAIRVNTLKSGISEIKKRLQDNWGLTQVPWCKEGFWIRGERRDLGNLYEHVLGYVYVQDPASMIPPIVLSPRSGEKVLDLCAAPGSKTTQLGQYMENKGLLVANDMETHRVAALGINIQRCGLSNCVITKMKAQWYKKVDTNFDRILVDAPCSASGTIRKSIRTVKDWSPALVTRIAGQQRSILSAAIERLDEGGTMVYSTCTLEPEENEGNVHWILENYPDMRLEKIELDIKRSKPIEEFNGISYTSEVKKCLRIWPQDNDTEGFFVSKFRKE